MQCTSLSGAGFRFMTAAPSAHTIVACRTRSYTAEWAGSGRKPRYPCENRGTSAANPDSWAFPVELYFLILLCLVLHDASIVRSSGGFAFVMQTGGSGKILGRELRSRSIQAQVDGMGLFHSQRLTTSRSLVSFIMLSSSEAHVSLGRSHLRESAQGTKWRASSSQ